MDDIVASRTLEETADVLVTIGRNIRQLRHDNRLTLQTLADRTRISPSMLSLLERGKTGPSIGTLVVIASALGAQMSDLLDRDRRVDEDMVSRREAQKVYETTEGVQRRIVKRDRTRGVEVAINEYSPGTANAPTSHAHEGYEYGLALEGALEITVDGQVTVLREGDLIAYPSTAPHRIVNPGAGRARALWINLKKD